MKYAALITAVVAGSASAFVPVSTGSRAAVALNAEKSQSMPFMNRPALVSTKHLSHQTIDTFSSWNALYYFSVERRIK